MTTAHPCVRTSIGTVEGLSHKGLNRWRAIPYARPPVGPLRFRAPEPALGWRGVRQCFDFEACAYQDRKYTLVGPGGFQPMSENCLTLNVVAPENHDGPLPVMFFVHGGGYLLGSTATVIYDGGTIARRGCVYVSANYRLGALGCVDLSSLSTAENPIDANLFLRDLTLALTWVRDNIAGFGGDPDNVTIFGESAGAHAVATLLAVPEAEGLFHRAISESPPSGMLQTADAAAVIADRLAGELTADGGEAAKALKVATPWQLVKTLERVMISSLGATPGNFGIGPSVDGEYLPQSPVDAMASGRAHPVPLIIGNNADEGKLFARLMDHLPTNRAKIDQLLSAAEPAVRERIMSAYPDYPGTKACLRLGGDYAFGSMAWQIAEAHARHAPTYLYRYDYAPRALDWVGLGATHATELFAVFDLYRTRFGGLITLAGDRRSSRRVSDNVQRHWDSFAGTGAPDSDWPAYAESDRAVMVFDSRSRVEYNPHPDRREAWQAFSLA